MTRNPHDGPGKRRRTGGAGRKLAASLATVVAAVSVVALPTFGSFTDEGTHFTDSVLPPGAADAEDGAGSSGRAAGG